MKDGRIIFTEEEFDELSKNTDDVRKSKIFALSLVSDIKDEIKILQFFNQISKTAKCISGYDNFKTNN